MDTTTTTVYLTRHGQTEWNVQHRMQGHQDSPLTPLGVQQAQWLNRGMENVRLDAIYASTSPRALHTAEIIRGDRKIPLQTSDAFKEIGMGVWEGCDSAELKNKYPKQYNFFWEDPEHFQVEGSETFLQVQERALGKLQEIIAASAGQSVLIVTHTVVIKVLMAYFENRPFYKLWDLPYIHPTCLCRVDVVGDTHEIVLHGDISHYEVNEAGMES
ncbi:histidine phosphatase family protein [Paenibacillus albidus]|uniref:histidine phosphatase family protein n=1 Tax=Paenibacillus albidus TaxID=2041023 RepID=UPI001BE636AA|nr:histidine phosphatase family protein [Paenibacillus albidus]MBT2290017.1 histidine phosphatase family protein [Paenibacillus albidus]